MNHPTGIFNGTQIIDSGFGESGEKKTPHIFVVFKTVHGEITGYFWMTDKAASFTMEKLHAMGVSPSMPWDEVQAGIADGSLLSGNLVQISIDQEIYNGEPRVQVKGVRPDNFVGGPARSETAAANAAKFGALWRKTGKGKEETPASKGEPTDEDRMIEELNGDNDIDVPF